MEIIKWDDSFSVGVREIDEQHKKLVQMINDFYGQLQAKKPQEALQELLNAMAQYTVTHFSTEERFFRLYKYPDTEAHKLEHSGFVEKVKEVQARLKEGKMVLSFEITTFIKQWLCNHILQSDKKYGPFFNSKGLH
jgi:hemerythrin